MKRAEIFSTGSYLPENIFHNEDFAQFPKASKLLISLKTGVFSRRYASDSDCTSDLAVKAARKCIEKVDFPVEKIKTIIVSTSSPDRLQPATATRVQYLLGAADAFCFDINSVCSGSTFGFCLSNSLISSGTTSNVLFIASEIYSKILNKKDFSTYPFFGDGAGAVLFKPGETKGVIHSVLKTDGSQSDTICVPGGGTMMPYEKFTDPNVAYFRMKGKDVFDFAISKGAEVICQLLEESGIRAKQVKCFICHQANINILLKIAERIQIPPERFYANVFRYGNTASASVLIALDEAITRDIVVEGDLVVTAAFGGGLSWGANLIQI